MSWFDLLKVDEWDEAPNAIRDWIVANKEDISKEDYIKFKELMWPGASKNDMVAWKKLAIKYPFYEDFIPYWEVEQ